MAVGKVGRAVVDVASFFLTSCCHKMVHVSGSTFQFTRAFLWLVASAFFGDGYPTIRFAKTATGPSVEESSS